DPGIPDGFMGPATVRAIKAYQRSKGYPPTGGLTGNQFNELRADFGVHGGAIDVSPSVVDIRTVQEALSASGHEVGAIDGKWGRNSQAALDAFRAERSVSRTGPPTAADLALLTGPAVPPAPPVPDANF